MRKIDRTIQVLLVILFFAIIMVSSYSTTAVNVIGAIGIAVSLLYIFLHGNLNGIMFVSKGNWQMDSTGKVIIASPTMK